ncbi:PQQ-binding-like beta-propeller repeat protein [Maribellus maritimus]|uniref:PQQ-binding-like beta-propeller repeat protein n=1 Tax=Maribellus maritimus TaxID=2870838 RepID=UPI001EEBF921|nr:PQQ-binding-like beta-propeller repeat protein [Maribellus maritimus]MCG6190514.1 PQQ-like beta-propeller repeat protein [Maribellus maritimus]
MKTLLKNVTGICVLFFVVLAGQAQDWPGWRGKNRDAKVGNFIAPGKWPDGLNKIWEVNVGLGDASVSSGDGKLYLLTEQDGQHVALCINQDTGNEIWKTMLHPSVTLEGGGASHPGPRTTPEVQNDKVYTLGTGGELFCLDAATGKIIWKNLAYKEVPKFYPSMSPLIVDGMCVAHLNGHDNGTIVAFNADNGTIIWELKGEPATYASPVLMTVDDEAIMVFQTETHVIGLSKKGDLLWKISTPGEQRFYNSATPVIDGRNVIVCGQGIGTKSFKIEKTGNTWSTSENWHNSEFGGNYNTPVLNDGFLFGHEARMGKAYCIETKNGESAWSDDNSNHRFMATLDLGDHILSMSANGKILIFEANSEKYNEVAAYNVSDTEVYATPLVTGAEIYVKNKEMLTRWEIK